MTAVAARVARVGRGFSAAWARFWFTPQSVATITAIRVALGLVVFAWGASILPDLRTFYFDDGLLGEPSYAEHRLGLFQWLTSDRAVVAVWLAMMLAAAALVSGRGVRVAAPVVWLAMLTMQQGAPSALNAGDLLLRIWTAYYALYAVLTPSRHLSVSLLGARGPAGERIWPVGPTWVVRLWQIQLSVIYPATVLAKLDGDTWHEGTASLYALGLVDFERFWVPQFVRESLVLGNLMTWFTLAAEISLPFLLWTRRTRRFGIVLGLLLHGGFDYTMRLGFFYPAMIIGYLSFLRPDEVASALGRLRDLVVGRRRSAGTESGTGDPIDREFVNKRSRIGACSDGPGSLDERAAHS